MPLTRSAQAMLKLVLTMAAIVALLVAGTGCTSSQAAVSMEEVEDSILRLANQERATRGLSVLSESPALYALAKEFAESRFSQELQQSGEIGYLLSNSWKETYGGSVPLPESDAAEQQIAYCLGQPELRDAMLRPEARATAVGTAIVGDTVYYTQVFDVVNSVDGSGEPIVLQENDGATDPSWEELKAFLEADETDEYPYEAGFFVCSDFAETLHNNAEVAGIRAAYVSVGFQAGPGHALDAFLVDGETVFVDVISGDKIAYVETAKQYGVIGLDVVEGFSYDCFETYAQQVEEYLLDHEAYVDELESYNAEIEEYNLAVEEYENHSTAAEQVRLQEWRETLEEWRVELDAWSQRLDEWETTLGLTDGYWAPSEPLVGVDDPTVVTFYVHW